MTEQDPQARFDAIVARAQGGNAEAQYGLGMILTQKDMAQALAWMQKSANGGFPQALFIMGVWYGTGSLLNFDKEKSLHYLKKASEAGAKQADYVLATALAKGIGCEVDWPGAVSLIIELAKKGEPKALSQLAFLAAMVPDDKGKNDAETLLKAACNVREPISLYTMGKRLLKSNGSDQELGKALLGLAAKFGHHVLALEDPLIKNFADENFQAPPFEAEPDWNKISDLLNILPIPDLNPRHDFETNPLVGIIPGFLTTEEADYLTATAAPNVKPSQVVDHIQSKLVHRDYRNSLEMRFSMGLEDLVVHAINSRIAFVTGEPNSHQEYHGVLRYEVGQEYKPHSDYFQPGLDGSNPEVDRAGQRIKTFLIYLNEDYEGGETKFIKLGLKVRGRKGDGVMFVNVTSDGGPHYGSLHAGLPVTQGVKWLSTMWIRDKEFSPRPIED